MKRTAAIVLTWNSAEDTIACVQSLEGLHGNGVDVILVDNASTDSSAGDLASRFPALPLLRTQTNLGYAGGNNIGIRHAIEQGYEYILVLNNDTLLEPDAVEILEASLDAHPEAGIASPKILYDADRSRIYAAGGHMSRLTCTGVAGLQGRQDRSLQPDRHHAAMTTFASGCAMLVRRSVFEHVGLFSEEFFMYFEDLEFSQRVGEQWKLLYIPASRIYHKVGAGTSWREYSVLYNYYYTRNRLWYFLDGPLWHRPYAIAFTLLNITLKSVLLLPSMLTSAQDARQKIGSLWSGFLAGLSSRPGHRSKL